MQYKIIYVIAIQFISKYVLDPKLVVAGYLYPLQPYNIDFILQVQGALHWVSQGGILE